ncbi:hypothetical protein PFICI_14200 [Pestalotiopsis fici W106-1]|uniref:Acetyltransferase n=1 Tax=Pestalotiopsis fici (strain W106-1 / CGMCC3.15140) TaxID=1229662 RepID=W3WKS1_PESFW|nr:uncharacterized protein PFICI_14200 [Pestalotiopsis fici W106-1]ETS74334.1 hypothetical protein PFICI_14200 [Pestalotiopsis fici W106-1]
MWGRILLTIDSVGLIAGSLKADYFSETHMFNPNWAPHAKFHNAQTVGLAVTLGLATLFYTWRKAQSPQLHREYMRIAALLGSIYWITGLLSILPEGTMGVDPEFGGPAFPQKYVFTPFLLFGLVGAWLEY